MKQYIPLKHINMASRCSDFALTGVYERTLCQEDRCWNAAPANMVLKLLDSLLGCGRTVVSSNCYISVELTNKLLDHDIHLLGTLCTNRKGNPCDVISPKLKR
jgi:hypothetical protein